MNEYELHQVRSAELIRKADHHRLVREVVRARRAARRMAKDDSEGRVIRAGTLRQRFARVA